MNFLLIYEGYENTGEHSSLSSNYIIIFIFQMLYYILYFLLFIIISHVWGQLSEVLAGRIDPKRAVGLC